MNNSLVWENQIVSDLFVVGQVSPSNQKEIEKHYSLLNVTKDVYRLNALSGAMHNHTKE